MGLELRPGMPTNEEIERRAQRERELTGKGYCLLDAVNCRFCGTLIGWYRTPAGKRLPMTYRTLEPHFVSCDGARRQAEKARRKRARRSFDFGGGR